VVEQALGRREGLEVEAWNSFGWVASEASVEGEAGSETTKVGVVTMKPWEW